MMNLTHLFLATAAVVAICAPQGAVASTSRPGLCKKPEDCESYGKGFVCTAVSTNRPGLEGLNMCIPNGAICTGSMSGACPTFSSWPSKYQQVMPLCAFQKVPNCNKRYQVTPTEPSEEESRGGDSSRARSDTEELFVVAANGVEAAAFEATDSSSSSANGTVECYERVFEYEETNVTVQGIYMCMDVDMYQTTNGGHIKELTKEQIISCGGNQTSGNIVLCNGQGTCAPKEAFSATYECKCNKGFEGDEYCSYSTSNECSNLGQCGVKGKCELEGNTGTCSCADGATGDQCNKCSGTACGKNGSCDADTGKCKCKNGATGTFCETTDEESKEEEKEDDEDSSAQISVAALGLIGMAFVWSGLVL